MSKSAFFETAQEIKEYDNNQLHVMLKYTLEFMKQISFTHPDYKEIDGYRSRILQEMRNRGIK